MDRNERIHKVMHAMLAMQRRAWEQGVAAQALLEMGETDLAVLLAKENGWDIPATPGTSAGAGLRRRSFCCRASL